MVGADDYEVDGVAHTLIEVIFFEFQPIEGSFGGFVSGVDVESFDHEALAAVLDTLIEERLQVLKVRRVFSECKHEFTFQDSEFIVQGLSSGLEGLLEHGGAIQIKQVKCLNRHLVL